MKKNYLIMSIGFGLLSSVGLSQNAYVTGNLKVKVEPNTLVYFGENLEMTEAVTADKVVENAGFIKIDGDYVNPSLTGENFVSTWNDSNDYGQVIINQGSSAEKLAMEKGKIDPALFKWGQFAIPFAYSNAEEAVQNLFGVTYSTNSERYKGSMMYWRNDDKPRWDQLTAEDTTGERRGLRPGEYVIINLDNNDGNILSIMSDNSTNKLTYKGAPTNAAYPMNYQSTFYVSGQGKGKWKDWRSKQNAHGEKYHTYFGDHLRQLDLESEEYAKFSYQFGNPYTSNIDLIGLATTIPNLMGIFQFGNNEWDDTGGSTDNASASKKVTYNGSSWAGDAKALIVKPFEPFVITLKDGGVTSFSFNDAMKTFSMDSSGAADVQGRNLTGAPFYQLGLQLYDNNNSFTGNRVYVVATSEVENGIENVLESEYSDFEERTGFYLAQEDVEGLPVAFSERKMDINSINTDFENKPVPIFFNRAEGDTEVYHLKANLFFGSIFNQLGMEESNYADTNSFYFYDEQQDLMLPITTDFSYAIPAHYNQENIFEVYWNIDSSDDDDEELSLEEQFAGKTIIYKDNFEHKVKFNTNWTTADVKVYDVSGRSIKSFNNVNTTSDLALKLNTGGVYIVRIRANTGEVYTQKIIK